MKKIKIVSDVYHTPIQKTEGAAAYDCFAFAPEEDVVINPNETKIVSLGFSVEVPKGYYMEVRGRSGLSSQGILVATGTVDSDYRGIVGAIITNTNDKPYVVRFRLRKLRTSDLYILINSRLRNEVQKASVLQEFNMKCCKTCLYTKRSCSISYYKAVIRCFICQITNYSKWKQWRRTQSHLKTSQSERKKK